MKVIIINFKSQNNEEFDQNLLLENRNFKWTERTNNMVF